MSQRKEKRIRAAMARADQAAMEGKRAWDGAVLAMNRADRAISEAGAASHTAKVALNRVIAMEHWEEYEKKRADHAEEDIARVYKRVIQLERRERDRRRNRKLWAARGLTAAAILGLAGLVWLAFTAPVEAEGVSSVELQQIRFEEAGYEVREAEDEDEKIEAALEEQAVQIGTCRITYYCACELCCGKWADGLTATGETPVEGMTIAVDPSVIPLGSYVKVGDNWYVAQDTGVSGNAIDIYLEDHNACLEAGVDKLAVCYLTVGD